MSGNPNWRLRPDRFDSVKAYARQVLYLGSADKVMAALANEYGADRKLPSRKWIEEQIAERNVKRSTIRRHMRGSEL